MKGFSIAASILLLFLAHHLAARMRHAGSLPKETTTRARLTLTQTVATSTAPARVYSL